MAVKETIQQAELRWAHLRILQEEYRHFGNFLIEVMRLLGFTTSETQHDIANYLAYGPQYLMVQAQRGQAKTTIAAALAVWALIHDPTHRVLIVSAGGTQANEISTLIVRIIMTMPELECMRPDTTNGDRSSVEHFDVHYSLKGVDKSPSVACVGIGSNLQGKRADLLVADDVESTKNALTATQRAQLLHLTLDFTSICSSGRIIWLGTPQTGDSIYNTLPARGVTVRIWPGRYPTAEQLDHYGEHLAPLIRQRIEKRPELMYGGGALKDQGQPLDPVLMDELKLQSKELDQGTSYFQLQHMLNTRMTDAMRHPLKTAQLVLLAFSSEAAPLTVVRGMTPATLAPQRVHGFAFQVQSPHSVSQETSTLRGKVCYVDPAGGGANADETAYAIVGFLNGNLYLEDTGGVPGGYGEETMRELARRIAAAKPAVVRIEKNMGFGAFQEVFTPVLRAAGYAGAIEEDYVTGQKETRIIGTLEPVINAGRLIVHPRVIERDAEDCQRYSPTQRTAYSLFHQLSKITKERRSLTHDDRLDAVEGAVRYWQAQLAQDQEANLQAQRKREWAEKIKDPLGYQRYADLGPKRGSVLSKYFR